MEIKRWGLNISIREIPETINNDILFCTKTLVFKTAFSKAVEAVHGAHSEALGNYYGINLLIKLMGCDSDFIAANISLACPDVNFVLIPEVPFSFKGEFGLLSCLDRVLNRKNQQRHHRR